MAKAINFHHTTQTLKHTHTHTNTPAHSLHNMRYLMQFAATVSIWRTLRSMASFILTAKARGLNWDTRTQHIYCKFWLPLHAAFRKLLSYFDCVLEAFVLFSPSCYDSNEMGPQQGPASSAWPCCVLYCHWTASKDRQIAVKVTIIIIVISVHWVVNLEYPKSAFESL